MTQTIVTIAVWQTLLDESPSFGQKVRRARIECVREEVRGAVGVTVDDEKAADALDFAAARFEAAYLEGKPISNVERARLIATTLGVILTCCQQQHLAAALGLTHNPVELRTRPGAARLLRELSREAPVVVLSDTWLSPGSALRSALIHHGLMQYLSAALFSDETGAFKITGDAWRLAGHRLGAGVDQIVHIGDHPDADGSAALAAGCAAAIVIQHPDHPVPSRRSDVTDIHVVADPGNVPAMVANLADCQRGMRSPRQW